MDYSETSGGDWSAKYKMPMTDNYQPKDSEFAGMQGKPLNYIQRRDKIQSAQASKIRSQRFPGRYDAS